MGRDGRRTRGCSVVGCSWLPSRKRGDFTGAEEVWRRRVWREDAWCYIPSGAAGVCRKNGYVRRLVERMADCSLCVFSFFFKFAADFLIFLDYHSGRSLMISYSIECWQLRKPRLSRVSPALPTRVAPPHPTPGSRRGWSLRGRSPFGTGLGDNHRLHSRSLPSEYVRLALSNSRSPLPQLVHVSISQSAPVLNSDQSTGNSRRLISSSHPADPMSDSHLAQAFYTEFQAARNGPSQLLRAICGWSLDSPDIRLYHPFIGRDNHAYTRTFSQISHPEEAVRGRSLLPPPLRPATVRNGANPTRSH